VDILSTAAPLTLTALFIVAAVTTWAATGGVKRLAERIGCVDYPGVRKIHRLPTPRLGGIAIVIGFALPLMLLTLHPQATALVQKNVTYLMAVLFSGSVIICLGIYDDILGSNATKKFAVQGFAAALLVGFGFRFEEISIAGVIQIPLGGVGGLATIIWIVGVINAVNFIDGMDSLLALVALSIASSFGVMAAIRGDMLTLVIMVALAGSLAGFLPWNRAPARIFMGDTGSLFIGLIFAACSIARESKTPTALAIAGPLLALALPIIDTLFVMQGRFLRGRSMAERFRAIVNADRTHIHHVLLSRYGSQRRALMIVFAISMLFGVAAVISVLPNLRWVGITLGGVTVLAMILVRLGGVGAPESASDPEIEDGKVTPLERRRSIRQL